MDSSADSRSQATDAESKAVGVIRAALRRVFGSSATYIVLAGGACVLLGLWFHAKGEVVMATNETLIVAGFALMALTLLIPMFAEFTVTKDGVSFKTRLDNIDQKQKETDAQIRQTIDDLAAAEQKATAAKLSLEQVLAKLEGREKASEQTKAAPAQGDGIDDEDPQAGQWGGLAESNGRKVSAVYRRRKGGSQYVGVTLTVEATNGAPLEGDVIFHLHDSFDPDREVVKARNGQARLEFSSWGAFTVGVECDGGRTRLELDLAKDPAAPAPWKDR